MFIVVLPEGSGNPHGPLWKMQHILLCQTQQSLFHQTTQVLIYRPLIAGNRSESGYGTKFHCDDWINEHSLCIVQHD